ncbi:hypothetical protein [Terrilactibacillus tamarindi]|uniref:hypothetical protein n=1 Tax=Terrilactibacillus tamarindi TaxID=2599694 RepID=UPI0018AD2AA9|nr:hypothetical protein [Terrilactibacillus tamarindi]
MNPDCTTLPFIAPLRTWIAPLCRLLHHFKHELHHSEPGLHRSAVNADHRVSFTYSVKNSNDPPLDYDKMAIMIAPVKVHLIHVLSISYNCN